MAPTQPISGSRNHGTRVDQRVGSHHAVGVDPDDDRRLGDRQAAVERPRLAAVRSGEDPSRRMLEASELLLGEPDGGVLGAIVGDEHEHRARRSGRRRRRSSRRHRAMFSASLKAGMMTSTGGRSSLGAGSRRSVHHSSHSGAASSANRMLPAYSGTNTCQAESAWTGCDRNAKPATSAATTAARAPKASTESQIQRGPPDRRPGWRAAARRRRTSGVGRRARRGAGWPASIRCRRERSARMSRSRRRSSAPAAAPTWR